MTVKRSCEQSSSTDIQVEQRPLVSAVKALDLPTCAEDLEQRRRISFERTEESSAATEPPMKRRRFARRNSKTPAMLLSSMSALVSSEFCDLDTNEPTVTSAKDANKEWDTGLKIAEELVRQLKLRRKSLRNAAA